MMVMDDTFLFSSMECFPNSLPGWIIGIRKKDNYTVYTNVFFFSFSFFEIQMPNNFKMYHFGFFLTFADEEQK